MAMVAAQTAFEVEGADGVEQRLAELARARGPLRRVAAALAAQWVAREGWSRLGYARLGDYARERLGVSPRSLQEWARVGAQLAELPALDAALVSGRVPWSKVRLLARFVTPDDERHWIGVAAGASVRRLERELRAVDRGALDAGELGREAEVPSEPLRGVRLRVSRSLAFKWQRTKGYTAKVEGQLLSEGDVLERVTAEVLSGLPVALETAGGMDPGVIEDAPYRADPPERLRWHPGFGEEPSEEAAELPVFLLPLLEGLGEADAFELDARLRRAVRLEQRLEAQLAPLLRQVTASEYEWRGRYASRAVLARECLGMSPSKLRALLRVERLGEVCPELRAAYRDGTLSWVQAQLLAPLLASDTEGSPGVDWRAAWVRFAQTVTVRCLSEAVERARLWRRADPAAYQAHEDDPASFAGRDPEPEPRQVPGERQTCARPREIEGDLRLQLAAPQDVARLFEAVLCTLRRAIEHETGRLPPESDVFEAMLDHALQSWGVDDPWLRRRMSKRHYAVFDRDDWRCVFPGCTSRRNLHIHHIRFRSAGGSDDASNLTTLCAFHHQRGVHDGKVTVRGRAPGALRFELGLRPDREPLATYRSGDRVA